MARYHQSFAIYLTLITRIYRDCCSFELEFCHSEMFEMFLPCCHHGSGIKETHLEGDPWSAFMLLCLKRSWAILSNLSSTHILKMDGQMMPRHSLFFPTFALPCSWILASILLVSMTPLRFLGVIFHSSSTCPLLTLPEIAMALGTGDSYWKPSFLGAMLVLGRVAQSPLLFCHTFSLKIPCEGWDWLLQGTGCFFLLQQVLDQLVFFGCCLYMDLFCLQGSVWT